MVELVIKISEEEYKNIKNDAKKFSSMSSYKVPPLYKAVNEGTPLPKHHGRLIDGDKAIADFANYGIDHMWDAFDLPDIIDESPTIIEADNEE